MIKKLSIAAVIIAVLILAGVLVFKRSIGPSEAASLVPEDTTVFIDIPNIPRTALRWSNTCLAKIANEPEMRTFLEKPLARLNSDAGFIEASRILNSLKPGNIFFATASTSVLSKDGIVGFQYWGTKQDFDNAVTRLRSELPPSNSAPATETYARSEILSSQHDSYSLYTASSGRWGFVATNVGAIKFALDRIAGSNSANTLASNPRYKSVLSHLLTSPDFLFFLQPDKLIDDILQMGKSYGAQPIPEHIQELSATEAIGATFKLDGELQRDAIFLLRPTETTVSLKHKSIQFTNPDTTFYLDLCTPFEFPSALLHNANIAAASQQPDLGALVDLAAAAYGPECGLIGNWPAGQIAPTTLLAIEIKDPEKAGQCLQQILSLFPETTTTENNGIKLYNIPSLSNPLISPTVAQTDSFLLLGLDATSVAQAASISSNSTTLKNASAFAPALATYESANKAFAFVDTRTLFDRAYTAARPIIVFGAAVMPGSSDIVDTTKLPQTETIARHLPPTVWSQEYIAGGILIKSSGPITLNQAMVATIVVLGLKISALSLL